MFLLRGFSVLATVLSLLLLVQAVDKYTDENRPYEFGFTIDGEQHRHEKKDDRGLIMGEYGFITADGVYHVTVYATDENGNFKIISMKNIRVKPYPTSPSRQGQSLPFPPSQQAPLTQGPSSQQKPGAGAIEQSPAAPVKTCSSCSIPTTTTPRPQLTDIAVVSKDNPAYRDPQSIDVRVGDDENYPQQNYPQQNSPDNNPQYPQQNYPDEYNNQQNYPEQNYPQDNYPNQPGSQNYPEGGSQNYPGQGAPGSQNYPQPGAGGQDYPQPGSPQDYPGQGSPQYPGQNGPSGDRNPKQYDVSQQDKPQLVYAQMQVVDRNTDVNYRGPGEREGLPNGLTKQDMNHLLYTFNYTVAFHGHHEDGYTDGSKVGYYFVTGRNGVRTRVDYVADEKGFRPKISQEVLDLLSEDVPKPETERDEKYGLKGYEFKWLYYPVDSKRR